MLLFKTLDHYLQDLFPLFIITPEAGGKETTIIPHKKEIVILILNAIFFKK